MSNAPNIQDCTFEILPKPSNSLLKAAAAMQVYTAQLEVTVYCAAFIVQCPHAFAATLRNGMPCEHAVLAP